MMIEAGLIAGYVINWVAGKALRAGRRMDESIDDVLDARLDRLHEAVTAKLAGHPVLADLDEEAGQQKVSDLTRQQVELALLAAAGKDMVFAQTITTLVEQIRQAEQAGVQTSALGQAAVAVAGGVSIQAHTGGVAAWSMGSVQIGRPPADSPDRGALSGGGGGDLEADPS